MSSSQLMSSPGVSARRSMSSRSATSSWYGKRWPASSSASSFAFVEKCVSCMLVSKHCDLQHRDLLHARHLTTVGQVLLHHDLDLVECALLRHAGDVARSREGNLGHRGRLDGQRAEVLWFE